VTDVAVARYIAIGRPQTHWKTGQKMEGKRLKREEMKKWGKLAPPKSGICGVILFYEGKRKERNEDERKALLSSTGVVSGRGETYPLIKGAINSWMKRASFSVPLVSMK